MSIYWIWYSHIYMGLETWKNSTPKLPPRLWDLAKFRALPLYRLWDLENSKHYLIQALGLVKIPTPSFV